jgi:toxin ParE1/3/4
MARIVRSPRAKHDIVEVLRFTKERWGINQAREYSALIREALLAVAADPARGKARDDILAGIFAHHISQRGRPARHILFYRIRSTGTVEIIRLLHDTMDFARHMSPTR